MIPLDAHFSVKLDLGIQSGAGHDKSRPGPFIHQTRPAQVGVQCLSGESGGPQRSVVMELDGWSCDG